MISDIYLEDDRQTAKGGDGYRNGEKNGKTE
jgi:hypothetical protein